MAKRRSYGKRRRSLAAKKGWRRRSSRRQKSSRSTKRKALIAAKDRLLIARATVSTPGIHGPGGTWYPMGHSMYKKLVARRKRHSMYM